MFESRRHAEGEGARWGAALAWGAAIAGAGIAATAVITGLIARSVVVPPNRREYDTTVMGVDEEAGMIELSRSPDAVTPGRYSLWFDGDRGLARVGNIVGETLTSVTRELERVEYGELSEGSRARFGGWWFTHPRDLEVNYENVQIDTDLGAAPAWLFPAEHDDGRWVIQVHGRASRRHECLRAVPVFRDEGWNSLLISYRNDGDAPYTADGTYSLGDSEWADVHAAMRFAIERGAKHLVLAGWSMGGATVLQAATRSGLADRVRGIVLDSPVVDWVTTLTAIAKEMRLPWVARQLTFLVMGAPWGRILTGKVDPIDFARLNFVTRASELTVPVLLQHSDDDGYVPSDGSHLLAEARPDIVTFEQWKVARHTKLWNYDADRWEGAIRQWLAGLSLHRA